MITLETLREFRIGGYALFDLAVSFLGIYLLSPLLTKLFLKIKIQVPKINWLFLTLPIGMLTHILFGSITPMTKALIDPSGHYIIKALIIILTILGLRGIKLKK